MVLCASNIAILVVEQQCFVYPFFDYTNIHFSLVMFSSTERFYKSVHTVHQSTSTSPANGITRCPFRAAAQAKPLHTSAVVDSQTTKEMAAASLVHRRKLEEQCEVKRSTKDGHCECAVQGLQPVGE